MNTPPPSSFTNLRSIPFGENFSHILVEALIKEATSPLDLAQTLVLVPTKRAVLTLKSLFKEKSLKHSLLVPKIIALGDLSNQPMLGLDQNVQTTTPINKWQRLGLLTQMILKFPGHDSSFRALKAAQSLADLLDEIELINVDTHRLETLVGADYAEHWQVTLQFLRIISQEWPKILDELNAIGPQTHLRETLIKLAEKWKTTPPNHRIVMAGTTGTVPATALLLKTILTLPRGQVFLPGLCENESEENLALTHPLYTLSHLLRGLNIPPHHVVKTAPTSDLARDRRHLLNVAMGEGDLHLAPFFNPQHWPQLLPCEDLTTEAKVIALIMRRAIETTTGPIVLVTPHQRLATWVEQELGRWDLVADRSDGIPLTHTPVGHFILLNAYYLKAPSACRFLSILKHPLCFKGEKRAYHLNNVRQLELKVIRHPDFDSHDLKGFVAKNAPDLVDWLAPILAVLDSGQYLKGKSCFDLFQHHLKVCKQLTGDEEDTTTPLWQQEDGMALKAFCDQLSQQAGHFSSLSWADYPTVLSSLMNQENTVRNKQGIGSRLHILGALEARLSHAEVMILGGLNEQTWPPTPGDDPWLSRSMRQHLGLPLPERRIGQSAHYFASCFYAPSLYLTRSQEEDGAPTLPSRWWQRLEAVHLKNQEALASLPSDPWQKWAQELTRPDISFKIQPPCPNPPLAARPKRLSVTEIELLMRDPYGIYAKHCLKVRPLAGLSPRPPALTRGKLIHAVLDQYIKLYGKLTPHLNDLLNLAVPYFQKDAISQTFWWQRFQKIAAWFIQELKQSHTTVRFSEQYAQACFTIGKDCFTLTAIADRLDVTDMAVSVVDYKTGTPPRLQDIHQGFSPQLPLEAWLVQQQGFSVLQDNPIPQIITAELWHLTGQNPGGKIITLADDQDLLIQTEAGLQRLVATFLTQPVPYLACPNPNYLPRYNDYSHLERLKEWQGQP